MAKAKKKDKEHGDYEASNDHAANEAHDQEGSGPEGQEKEKEEEKANRDLPTEDTLPKKPADKYAILEITEEDGIFKVMHDGTGLMESDINLISAISNLYSSLKRQYTEKAGLSYDEYLKVQMQDYIFQES